MTIHCRSLLLASMLLAAAPTARADSTRCAGGIVSAGDAKLDLLAKCGRPALVENGAAERGTFDRRQGIAHRVISPVDVWTYDFGRNHFLQVVRIVRGKISTIERGGYGYAGEPPPRARPSKATCAPAALGEGKLEHDVLSRCGEPAVIDEWQEETAAVRLVDGETVYADVVARTIAVWTYDFGPSSFVRFVRMEDGKVTRVETGSYGYGE